MVGQHSDYHTDGLYRRPKEGSSARGGPLEKQGSCSILTIKHNDISPCIGYIIGRHSLYARSKTRYCNVYTE